MKKVCVAESLAETSLLKIVESVYFSVNVNCTLGKKRKKCELDWKRAKGTDRARSGEVVICVINLRGFSFS